MRPARPLLLLGALAVLAVLGACDGGDAAPPIDASVPGDTPSLATVGGSGSVTATGDASGPATDASPDPTSSEPAPTAPPSTLPAPPVTGIPGLDSDDAFCGAWSRFAGTWQVLLVGSTFLDDPDRVAAWEIASSQVVDDAYRALAEHLPDELAGEADAAIDGYFGVLHRRAVEARAALGDAGASGEQVGALSRLWLGALAARDPTSPDLPFAVPGDLAELVARAVADFRNSRVEFHVDPSLAVTVDTPLTDVYVRDTCPDGGTLAGGEVSGDELSGGSADG